MLTQENVGLQLWTVRQQASRDLAGTLTEVAAAGYQAVEVVGYGNGTVSDMRQWLSRLNIRAVSVHVTPGQLANALNVSLHEANQLGCDHVVLSGSPTWSRGSQSGARRLADQLNEWGDACRNAGLKLGYHNHAREFWDLDGNSMFRILVGACDPELVHFEIDVYWVMHAGKDPAEVIQSCAGQVFLLHAKEMSNYPDRRDTRIGEGITPWQDILVAATDVGVQWLMVEQEDDPTRAIRDIRHNRSKLAALLSDQ